MKEMFKSTQIVKALGDSLLQIVSEFPDYLSPSEKMRYKKVALRVIALTLNKLEIPVE